MMKQIEIKSEIDPRHQEICRFTSERTFYVGTRIIDNPDEAKGLPLAERLMSIPGILKIQLIGHLVVVTKKPDRKWQELISTIAEVLTAFLISSLALSREQVQDQMMLVGRTIREKVQYLIDAQINPGVAEHGGSVQVVNVIDGSVYLRLHGGCQGCGAADFTLKQGIESILKRAVPEIQSIIDVTNHSAGANPYYRRPIQ